MGRNGKQPGEIRARHNFLRRGISGKETRAIETLQVQFGTDLAQPGPFSQAQHRYIILLQKLLDTLRTRLTHVGRVWSRIEIVRIDLKRDQTKGLKRARLND